MATGTPIEDQLLVAIHDRSGFVRVYGRGTFKVGSALKRFGDAAVEACCERIVLDMEHCVGMDSTFMGVLAGMATKLGRRKGCLVLLNMSEKTRGLLATLGLDQLVHPYMAGTTPDDAECPSGVWDQMKKLEAGGESRVETAETMLEAHENLVDVTAENYPRFKDVLIFLREDLEKASQQACTGSEG